MSLSCRQLAIQQQQRQNYIISGMTSRVNSSCTVLSVSFLIWCNSASYWFLRMLHATYMGVDHGRDGGTSPPPEFVAGGLSPPPHILSCCKILSTKLLALQCRKMCFCLYSRTFIIVSPAMHPPPRIPVGSTRYAYDYIR